MPASITSFSSGTRSFSQRYRRTVFTSMPLRWPTLCRESLPASSSSPRAPWCLIASYCCCRAARRFRRSVGLGFVRYACKYLLITIGAAYPRGPGFRDFPAHTKTPPIVPLGGVLCKVGSTFLLLFPVCPCQVMFSIEMINPNTLPTWIM